MYELLEGTAMYSMAYGECKDIIPWLLFTKSTFVESRCAINLKPAPQGETQDK